MNRVSLTDAVLAGSPEFLRTLLVPLEGRLGAAPRVADTPHQAFALCQANAGLLVYEFRGREWSPLSGDLRRLAGTGLVVVVALPPEHASEAAALSASASAVVPWRGDPRPVLEAVARLDARPTPSAPARPAPILAAPVAAPRMPAGPRAAAPPSPTPPPVAPRATPPGPPALRVVPSPAANAAAPRAAAPVVAADGARSAAAVKLVPPAEEADPFAGLFEDDAPAAEPPPPSAAAAAPPAAPPPVEEVPFVPSSTWPGTVLPASDAEGLLAGALVGLWPEETLRPLTERVLEGLSVAERSALQDQELPFEVEPVRRAAALRWQVAAALACAPPPGPGGELPPVDQAAVRAILSGIDAVLGDLKRMSEGATPEILRAIENVRHLLVKEAIDLTETVQRLVPEGTAETAIADGVPAARARVPGTRLLYNVRGRNTEVGSPKPWGLIVLLGLLAAAAAGFHGYRYVNRPRPQAPTLSGAPSGTSALVMPGAKMVAAPPGQRPDPQEVERFKTQEQAKGNDVKEVLPGTFVVVPAGRSAGGPTPSPSQGGTP
jgi:hypothetical protein